LKRENRDINILIPLFHLFPPPFLRGIKEGGVFYGGGFTEEKESKEVKERDLIP